MVSIYVSVLTSSHNPPSKYVLSSHYSYFSCFFFFHSHSTFLFCVSLSVECICWCCGIVTVTVCLFIHFLPKHIHSLDNGYAIRAYNACEITVSAFCLSMFFSTIRFTIFSSHLLLWTSELWTLSIELRLLLIAFDAKARFNISTIFHFVKSHRALYFQLNPNGMRLMKWYFFSLSLFHNDGCLCCWTAWKHAY